MSNNGRILNLTRIDLEGLYAQVDEPPKPVGKKMVLSFQNFPGTPNQKEVEEKAYELADYCGRLRYQRALIDGPGFLVRSLKKILMEMKIEPILLSEFRKKRKLLSV